MKISLLIPTLPKRKTMFERLVRGLEAQIDLFAPSQVEILFDDRESVSIGTKRNDLLQKATGEYVVFVDDDDSVCDTYIDLIIKAITDKPDCCSLNGIITFDGQNPKPFKHSIEYRGWYEMDNVYYRPPNHLNVIKTSIAKQFKFPEKSHGEDKDYSLQLSASGLLKTESKIYETIYYYKYIRNK